MGWRSLPRIDEYEYPYWNSSSRAPVTHPLVLNSTLLALVSALGLATKQY